MVLQLILGAVAVIFGGLFLGANFLPGLQYTFLHVIFLVLGGVAFYALMRGLLQSKPAPASHLLIVGALAFALISLGVPNFLFSIAGAGNSYGIAPLSVIPTLTSDQVAEINAWFNTQKVRQTQALPCQNQGLCQSNGDPECSTSTTGAGLGNWSIIPATESYSTCYVFSKYAGTVIYNLTFVQLGGQAILPQPTTPVSMPTSIPATQQAPINSILLLIGAVVFAWFAIKKGN